MKRNFRIFSEGEASWLQFEALLEFPDLFHTILLKSALNSQEHINRIIKKLPSSYHPRADA